jgi:aspartate 1-decarboxylase
MLRQKLRSKISYAVVTQAQLYYEGSITIDSILMQEAGLVENERVEVLNLNTGSRFSTYVIKGDPDSGNICLNGPAARLGFKGDKIIILSYGYLQESDLEKVKTTFIVLNAKNKIEKKYQK